MAEAPKASTEPGLTRALAPLSDVVRLRLLRLIEDRELYVGELEKVLQLPQSTVSRHLKVLHEAGWVQRRSEGTAKLYRMDLERLDEPRRALWPVIRDQIEPSPALADDDHRLAGILAQRAAGSQAFFGQIVGEWDRLRGELFGAAFTTESLLGLLDPGWTVADLGCGTGLTSEYLAPVVERVIAVDREPAMLEAARQRLARHDNVEYRREDLTELSIAAGSVDAAVISLVMVYMPEPAAVVEQAARILKPGGRLLVVDLVAHDRDSYVDTLGHRHLGFDEAAVAAWAEAAGLGPPRYRRLRPDPAARGPGLFAAMLEK